MTLSALSPMVNATVVVEPVALLLKTCATLVAKQFKATYRRKMHCLEQLNGQALFLAQRRCLQNGVCYLCEKQCHRVYAIVEQPSRSIILGALFFLVFRWGNKLDQKF